MSNLTLFVITQLLVIAYVSVYFWWISLPELGWFEPEAEGDDFAPSFNLHSMSMSFAFPVLMTESILAFKLGKQFTRNKTVLTYWHLVSHLLSLFFIIYGVTKIWSNHSIHGYGHVYSLHSWLGIFTLLTFTGQFLIGFWAYQLRSPDLKSVPDGWQNRNISLRPYHSFFGLVTYYCGLATCIAGLMEKLAFVEADSFTAPIDLANILALLIFAIGITVGSAWMSPVKSRTINEHTNLLNDTDP